MFNNQPIYLGMPQTLCNYYEVTYQDITFQWQNFILYSINFGHRIMPMRLHHSPDASTFPERVINCTSV